jgi:chromosome segregation ATPase
MFKKLLFMLLFVCLLLSVHTLCLASPQVITMPIEQFNSLETNSQLLMQKVLNLENSLLKSETNSEQLQTMLEKYRMDSETYQKELEKLKLSLQGLEQKSELAEQNSQILEASLKNIRQYLDKYEKQMKAKVRSVEAQRNVAILGIVVVLAMK